MTTKGNILQTWLTVEHYDIASLKSSPQSKTGVSDGIKTCVIAVTWRVAVQVYEGQYGEKADVWSRLGFAFMDAFML